jgi:lipopolysaccharide transport system permease protein
MVAAREFLPTVKPEEPEMFSQRELLFYLIWRDISVRYKQTILGSAWAILQPLKLMLIFTFVFGRFVKVDSEGFPTRCSSLRG